MPGLEILRKLVAERVASPYSDFYRELYGVPADRAPRLSSEKEWRLLPHFTKESFLERPMREYTFVPRGEVDTIYYTSGTSGKPPAFCPRVAYDGSFGYRKRFYDFDGAFAYSLKPQHRSEAFLRDIGSAWPALTVDAKQLRAFTTLAKAVGVTSFSAHTFTIHAIGEAMKEAGINADIRLIDFVGETCSLALYAYMRETFPNASIVSFYGLSEAEGAIGVPCRALSDDEPYPIFHAHPDFYLELINEDGEPLQPKAGIEGELLMTDLSVERAFPLTRYRPGDTVRVVDEACSEHGEWTFTVLGKTAADFMLIPGGQLRADEVERVLRMFPGEVTDHFELHRYDAGSPKRPMLKVELKVQTIRPVDLAALAERIAGELRVAPGRTYREGVEQGRYMPLVCAALSEATAERKHRRMIKH